MNVVRSRHLVALVPVAFALLSAGCAGIGLPSPDPADPSPSASPSPNPLVTYMLALTGPVEVPPGDRDGAGTAVLSTDVAKGEVCVEFTVAGIDPANAAHIHTGAAGTAGPIAIDLPSPGVDGTGGGCVPAEAALLAQINAKPAGFYVNVHNEPYPKGALRRQLDVPAPA
jgi:CHRD domain-containing protein